MYSLIWMRWARWIGHTRHIPLRHGGVPWSGAEPLSDVLLALSPAGLCGGAVSLARGDGAAVPA